MNFCCIWSYYLTYIVCTIKYAPSSGSSFDWYKLVHIRKHWFRWKNQLVVKKLSIQLIFNSYWIRLWPNQKYKNRNTVTQKCSIQKLRRSCVFFTRSVSKIRSYWLIYASEVSDWIYFDLIWLAKNTIRSKSIWNPTLFLIKMGFYITLTIVLRKNGIRKWTILRLCVV